MKKMLTLAGVSVMALSLGTGVASAQVGGSIDTTGPDSDNVIKVRSDFESRVKNHNDVRLENTSKQKARSGHATVRYNTTGGDARTGDAANDNLTRASIVLKNTGNTLSGNSNATSANSFNGSIKHTGPNSDNYVSYDRDVEVSVSNYNDVNIDNYSTQKAKTGHATVRYNTTGGDARTGDARNINTTDLSVRIEN